MGHEQKATRLGTKIKSTRFRHAPKLINWMIQIRFIKQTDSSKIQICSNVYPFPAPRTIFSQRTGTNHKSNQAREEQSGNLDSFEETDWQHPLGCSGGKLQQLYGLISWEIIRITMVKYHLYNKSSTLQQW